MGALLKSSCCPFIFALAAAAFLPLLLLLPVALLTVCGLCA